MKPGRPKKKLADLMPHALRTHVTLLFGAEFNMTARQMGLTPAELLRQAARRAVADGPRDTQHNV